MRDPLIGGRDALTALPGVTITTEAMLARIKCDGRKYLTQPRRRLAISVGKCTSRDVAMLAKAASQIWKDNR